MLVQVHGDTEIETGARALPKLLLRQVEQLTADGQVLGQVALQLPTCKPGILCGGRMIDTVADTSIRLPVAPAFLQPDRQIKLRAAIAQIF